MTRLARPTVTGLVVLVAAAVLLSACGDSAGGVDDFDYWKARSAEGDNDALDRLAGMGVAAVPMFNQLLAAADEATVSTAAMAIPKLKDAGAGTLGTLIATLERFPDQAFVVQAIKANAEAAVPEIVAVLKTGEAAMQAQAAKLLNGVDVDRKPAVQPLLAILASGAPDTTKIEAMGALASIGVDADEAARPVLEQIQAAGGELGTYAGRAIKRLDSAQKMAEIRGER